MKYAYPNLKVAFIHPRLEGGGAERVSYTTAKRFVTWGISCHFITALYREQEFSLPDDALAVMRVLPNSETFYTEENRVALVDYINENRIQVAFVCYIEGDFMEKVIPMCPDCKFVYWHHSSPFWELQYKREYDSLPAKYYWKSWIKWHLLGGKWRKRLNEEAVLARYYRDIQLFDKYIVLHPTYAHEIEEALRLSEAEKKKLCVFTNTLPPSAQKILPKSKKMVFVGSLTLTPKRVDRLLKIWKRASKYLPDWRLELYGAGQNDLIFQSVFHKYKAERLYVRGYEKELSNIYNDAAILCVTSSIEGWPMVICEAQANGVVPIAMRCSAGLASLFKFQGEATGVLVENDDEEAYIKELVRLGTDEAWRQKLQRNVLNKVQDYSENINDENWIKFFSEILGVSKLASHN